MVEGTDGKYTFKMEVTPAINVFIWWLIPESISGRTSASYTQAELQDLRTMVLNDHEDDYSSDGELSRGLKLDQLMTALKRRKGNTDVNECDRVDNLEQEQDRD